QTQASDSKPRTTTQERTTEQPAATTPPAASDTPADSPPADTAPDNEPEEGPGPASETNEPPSKLDARGYALLQQGNASAAVPVLEAAVKGFEAQGDAADPTGYGYALFNLGTAYAQTGRPADAIPLFEKRLAVSPNDRPGQVRKALRDAQRAAGQGGGKGNGNGNGNNG
ncbi:MAG TPA: tetratricopeptide repeat protein, partial [Solirubrobacteraceae bacterium]|nr:tetratricopeptide repeat protein [Solirubrobacteraceae bacterium]